MKLLSIVAFASLLPFASFAETFCQLPISSQMQINSDILIPANSTKIELASINFRGCSLTFQNSTSSRVLRAGQTRLTGNVSYNYNEETCSVQLAAKDDELVLVCVNFDLNRINQINKAYFTLNPAAPVDFP